MRCILCQQENKVRLIKKDFGGIDYIKIDGTTESIKTDRNYDIWHCDVCDTRFVSPYEDIDYDKVYTQTDLYKGLLEFAEELKKDPDPWWRLIARGQPYYAALDFVKGKKELIGLEVGCGYGYLTMALNGLGHKFMGIEVSDYVVNKCNELYGGGFYKADIRKLKIDKLLDLIIGLEVIEHLSEPLDFMKAAKNLLKNDGSILITTPDRTYLETRQTSQGQSMLMPGWAGEMPPIHLAIYSKKSMGWLAQELNMKLSFTDFPGGPAQTIGAIFSKRIFY